MLILFLERLVFLSMVDMLMLVGDGLLPVERRMLCTCQQQLCLEVGTYRSYEADDLLSKLMWPRVPSLMVLGMEILEPMAEEDVVQVP